MMSTFKHPYVILAWLGFNLPSKPDVITISNFCSGTLVENKTLATLKTSDIT